jgi:putative transposase
MKGKRFTEEQIHEILKESEAGLATPERCRKYGISKNTFYNWRSKYLGIELSDLKKMRQLEDENDTATTRADRSGKFRDECLNEEWFVMIKDARNKIEVWRNEYNTERPFNEPWGLSGIHSFSSFQFFLRR